jgi:hypothetical protein
MRYVEASRRPLRAMTAVACIALVLVCACVAPVPVQEPDPITFALMGSTAPESPFNTVSPWLEKTILAINAENPVFIMHTGEIVFGGDGAMGIKESDIQRQFDEFAAGTARALPILYTMRGELDVYAGSSELYARRTGRPAWYSFNYGNLHFAVLDTNDPEPAMIGPAQLRWLEEDLKSAAGSSAMFLFTHHPVVLPQAAYYGETTPQLLKNAGALTAILARYPVKAVFSGHLRSGFTEKKDGILYVTAGCGNYNEKLPFAPENQYYLVRYTGREITVTEKKLKTQ